MKLFWAGVWPALIAIVIGILGLLAAIGLAELLL